MSQNEQNYLPRRGGGIMKNQIIDTSEKSGENGTKQNHFDKSGQDT